VEKGLYFLHIKPTPTLDFFFRVTTATAVLYFQLNVSPFFLIALSDYFSRSFPVITTNANHSIKPLIIATELLQRYDLLCARWMNGDAIIKILLRSAHFDGDAEALQHLTAAVT
jgi:hypothetical protein